MLVSLNWLKNYVDISGISIEDLAERITKSGIEVDGIHYIAEESKGLVVGYVESCEQHPNADKLNLCQVDVGEETLQIICGAPNIKQGQKVIVAKPGGVLPGNFKIKKVKLRGIESNGMICSLQEIGINEKYVPKDVADGIFVLPEDTVVGEDIEPLMNLNDAVLEFDLTPNRADCLSMLGVAYEVAAVLDKEVNLPDYSVATTNDHAKNYISVDVESPELNPYYGAFIIKDVQVKQSPLWLRNYLMAAGVRPINNVVDITNYVLFEYGQPLHAFDYDHLDSKKIVVRQARENEKMTTLDDVERTLTSQDLLITDGEKPIALAGVMGGANTEVNENTTTVLLEAAYFDPYTVRKTVNKTGLRSEASTRFEKGVDPNRVKEAGLRACLMLKDYADGEVLEGAVEFDKLDRSSKKVMMNQKEINKRLGTDLTTKEIEDILRKLGFDYKQVDIEFEVSIPTRRGDISIFEDMLEEVARIYGYDHLPYTLPKGASKPGALTERQNLKRKIKQFLQGVGLSETITYSLTNKDYIDKLISPEIKILNPKPARVALPMTEDHYYLRLSLLPEMLKSMAYNIARKQTNLAFYEMGTIFVTDEEKITKQPNERLRLSGAITGHWMNHEWQQEKKSVDFYVIKGIIESLFSYLDVEVDYKRLKHPDLHPGRSAMISLDESTIGFIGQVHPSMEKAFDLKETYVFDLDMEQVLEAYEHIPSFSHIPRYPAIARDVAFVLDESVPANEVQRLIEELGSPVIKDVHVFDLYMGDNLPDGKKSVAYNLIYQDPHKTLKDEEVDQSFREIIEKVNEQFDAYVRS
ncbi:phenylalanine--tRNA ligase subunit beta [Virgibacillus sp. MSJ-26]|uniref:phenylalanine--tRNA ligase subunit beta n=1 Tax=Virgibacillus sp. MSJ-26 TaxID=2841522 RepID=UPI001C0FC510|nr:phenylalanine--tRNA ligase subunit beta [Virgibacillus sp. MSJ-26]